MPLTSLDYWRLADELSVIDAAILITGNDPSNRLEAYDSQGDAIRGPNGERVTYQRRDYDGFEATFKALRVGIRSNKLRARIHHQARHAKYDQVQDYDRGVSHFFPIDLGPECKWVGFDFLVARRGDGQSDFAKTSLNFSVDDLRGTDDFYLWKEPDWSNTTIAFDDLREWLASREIYPSFFFPKGDQEGFRNNSNPRYAPKLAACVAAWEAVRLPARRSSVKQTLKDWLRSNAAAFGVGEDGIVSETAAEELAKIVNWQPSGGATPTAGNGEPNHPPMRQPVDNYPHGYPSKDSLGNRVENSDDDDTTSIPF